MVEGWFLYVWPTALVVVQIVVALLSTGHAILCKREVKGVIGWVGVIWLTPLVGTLLYVVFGINRIERKAHSLRRSGRLKRDTAIGFFRQAAAVQLGKSIPDYIAQIAEVGNRLPGQALSAGNDFEPLENGDEVFPAMLQAINNAEHSIALCTYIFDNDRAGKRFVEALAAAAERGVEVRVLIDAVGSRYSWSPAIKLLRQRKVPAALFLPTLGLTYFVYSNLRNHRKIMVIDGEVAFTGGINIREGCLLEESPRSPVQDLHFRVAGPVVHHLQASLAADWQFATGEQLRGEAWFPPISSAGHSIARGITDGPDEDFDKLRLTFMAAIAVARERITIVTPYFLPDETLISALNVAAMRGVEVDIIVPDKNNLRMVGWASNATQWYVLERGCRVWRSPPPFDHSKLLVVDGLWCCFGSANWDPRSLRLNFEFNVECYDAELAETLQQIADAKRSQSREISQHDLESRPLPARLRDGAARLLSPYL